jgi:hypothetical protein
MENRSLLLNHKWASRLCVNEWNKGGTELKEGFKISGRREEEQRGKKKLRRLWTARKLSRSRLMCGTYQERG